MLTEYPAALASPPGASPAHGEKEEKKLVSAEASEQRYLFAPAQRRKLPDERKSITHKFSVGDHEGYIIVGMYEEATPGEIFIKMAKEGSTQLHPYHLNRFAPERAGQFSEPLLVRLVSLLLYDLTATCEDHRESDCLDHCGTERRREDDLRERIFAKLRRLQEFH